MSYSPDLLTRIGPSSEGWGVYEVRYLSHGNNSPDYNNQITTGTAYALYDRYHPNGGARTSTTGDKIIKVGINPTQSDYDEWQDHGAGNPNSVVTDTVTGIVSLIGSGGSTLYTFQKPTTASWISSGGSGGQGGQPQQPGVSSLFYDESFNLNYTVSSTAASGQYEIYRNGVVQISIAHVTGTSSTGYAPGPFDPSADSWVMKLGSTTISQLLATSRKVSCNFW